MINKISQVRGVKKIKNLFPHQELLSEKFVNERLGNKSVQDYQDYSLCIIMTALRNGKPR